MTGTMSLNGVPAAALAIAVVVWKGVLKPVFPGQEPGLDSPMA
jgi:hypothetical protein